MSFTESQIEMLKAPLDSGAVETRQKGRATLAYVDSFHVTDECNRIWGHGGWERHTVSMDMVQCEAKERDHQDSLWYVGYIAKCEARVWDGERWIVRHGTGFGQGMDRDLGQAHESAVKEAETDAFKRAMMTFGYTFGLALYDSKQAHVSQKVKTPKTPANQIPDDPKQALRFWGIATDKDLNKTLAASAKDKGWEYPDVIELAWREHVRTREDFEAFVAGLGVKQ